MSIKILTANWGDSACGVEDGAVANFAMFDKPGLGAMTALEGERR